MFSTIALVAGFGSSSKLASAYGVAVTATMLISAVLFYYVARDLWNWNRLGLNLLMGMFMLIDLSFSGPASASFSTAPGSRWLSGLRCSPSC